MSDLPRREFLAKSGAALAGLASVTTIRAAFGAATQGADAVVGPNPGKEVQLKRYVIEREVPNIGLSSAQQFCDIAKTSDAALAKLAPTIQWEHSYVADNKTFCVYLADSEDAIREHSKLSGFPANKITLIDTIIDPTTANYKA